MNNKLSRHELSEVVAKLLGNNAPHRTAKSLAAYLLENKRTGELDSLMRDLKELRIEKSGIVELTAVSAFELSAQVRRDIEAEVKRLHPKLKQVIINERHDRSMVSGVRLELPNQQLDLTARAKLNQFIQLTQERS